MTIKLIWGPLSDKNRAPKGVARGGAKGRCGSGKICGGVGCGNRSTRGGRDGGGEEDRDQEGDDELGEGGGPDEGYLWRGPDGGRSYVARGGTDTQGERGLPW